jgi:hypothetical protein
MKLNIANVVVMVAGIAACVWVGEDPTFLVAALTFDITVRAMRAFKVMPDNIWIVIMLMTANATLLIKGIVTTPHGITRTCLVYDLVRMIDISVQAKAKPRVGME